MARKFLEYWSPAPLPEWDAGKNAAALANLKEPPAVDLEISSDLSVGGESDFEVVGATVPPNSSAPERWRWRLAIRKVSAAKAAMRGCKHLGPQGMFR